MKHLIVSAVLVLMATSAWAGNEVIVMPTENGLSAITSERLSVLGTGTTNFASLTTAQVGRFREAHIQNTDGDPVRVRVDGTAPTSTVGFSLNADAVLVIKDVRAYQTFRAIADSSGSGASLFGTVFGR